MPNLNVLIILILLIWSKEKQVFKSCSFFVQKNIWYKNIFRYKLFNVLKNLDIN